MPFGRRVQCGLAATAVLAAFLSAAFPATAPAQATSREQLALQLFNTTELRAAYYAGEAQTVAQATTTPRLRAELRRRPRSRRPGCRPCRAAAPTGRTRSIARRRRLPARRPAFRRRRFRRRDPVTQVVVRADLSDPRRRNAAPDRACGASDPRADARTHRRADAGARFRCRHFR